VAGDGVDAVRRLYRAFNERDTEAARELMGPDIEWVNPDDAIEPGTRHGYGEYQEALRSLRETFDRMVIEVERIEASGDRVAAGLTIRARGRGSGLEATMRQGGLWTFREGRAVRYEWFGDPDRPFELLRG
jgi:ketosteroid isomerase-like protein